MLRVPRRPWSNIFLRMASTTVRQPPWATPQGKSIQPQLKVYNSLTRSKVPFVPIEHDKITWYSCGPTVYDDAHLGHARNYVTIDILRRIMQDYFKFKVRFVMNITDVDDKIILRGRQRHFYEIYKQKHRYIDAEVLGDALKAWLGYIEDNLPRVPLERGPSPLAIEAMVDHFYRDILAGEALVPGNKPGDNEAKVRMHINTVKAAAQALTADPKTLTPTAFYAMTNDIMCVMLDKQFGNTIKGDDYAIFTDLTQEYEQRFFQDMRDLNVLDPDELVRVTESGEDIAQFVDKIVRNKFGYPATDGSIYFDIQAFEAAGNSYARLEPWNRGDKNLQADGEGPLSKKGKSDKRLDYKRGPGDFALWKLSRAGEPAWPSRWGPGRPGWHIECSAMASAKLGRQMDIHSGGIDLAFPHHDNELAQSEAYWTEGHPTQWVNYFFHMGHLSIQGSKMSKSLKNFTTIRAALDREGWTSRGLRIVFLLGGWRDGIEITDDLVKESTAWEDRVDNFFINSIEALKSMSQADKLPILADDIANAKSIIQEALLDSFNTPVVMNAISQLINKYNSSNKADLTFADHQTAAHFVTQIVNMFGLNGTSTIDSQQLGWQGIDIPDSAKEYVYPLAKMRDELRQAAVAKSITADKIKEIISAAPHVGEPVQSSRPRPSYARALTDFRSTAETAATANEAEINKQILALCDRVRDVDLWNLDIYLEDRDNMPALVRPVTQGLRAARREKEERALQKEEARLKREQEARDKLEKGRTPPTEMFRPPHTDEFGAWDGDGLPTVDKAGTPLAGSRIKKLKKDWDRQKKAHEAFLAAVQKGTLSLQPAP